MHKVRMQIKVKWFEEKQEHSKKFHDHWEGSASLGECLVFDSK
jgi:hypothetical protein